MVTHIFPDNIEIAPTNKSRCRGCGCFIGKGEPRLTKSFLVADIWSSLKHYTNKDNFCHQCSFKELDKSLRICRRVNKNMKLLKADMRKILRRKETQKIILANRIKLSSV